MLLFLVVGDYGEPERDTVVAQSWSGWKLANKMRWLGKMFSRWI